MVTVFTTPLALVEDEKSKLIRVARKLPEKVVRKVKRGFTENEKKLFIDALKVHGKSWEKLQLACEEKSKFQLLNFAQKFKTDLVKSDDPVDLSLLKILRGPCIRRPRRTGLVIPG